MGNVDFRPFFSQWGGIRHLTPDDNVFDTESLGHTHARIQVRGQSGFSGLHKKRERLLSLVSEGEGIVGGF